MILREYEENGFKITEYTNDGETVSTRIKEKILTDEDILPPITIEPFEPQPTIEEMQAKTLLNTEVLIAMKNIGV